MILMHVSYASYEGTLLIFRTELCAYESTRSMFPVARDDVEDGPISYETRRRLSFLSGLTMVILDVTRGD
jgi:hypothetical protein